MFFALLVAAGAYWCGRADGYWRRAAEERRRLERYRQAVVALDQWCGHEFPQARLIAAHVQAVGEGRSLNAGTPAGDEPCTVSGLRDQLRRIGAQPDSRDAQIERLQALINTPELHDFSRAVVLEAAHQRERWGSGHDAGKTPADWFWLTGYLAGKALHAQTAGNTDKALHHTISTAAALANWHASITGAHVEMRPGIDPAAHGIAA